MSGRGRIEFGLGLAVLAIAACAQSSEDCYEDASAANRECAREAMRQVAGRTLALGRCARDNAVRIERCTDLMQQERNVRTGSVGGAGGRS